MLGKVAFLILACLMACSPKPAERPPATAKVAAPAASPKLVTMICRNSESGKKVECGTPNAVMVGMADH